MHFACSSHQKGLWGETLAALCLRLKGYQILERRYKTPVGELDLIIRRGHLLVGVEVKLRKTREEALKSLSPRGLYRMRRALSFYLTLHDQYAFYDIRLDGFFVGKWCAPFHLQGIT